MLLTWMIAGDVCIQAFDSVRQSMFDQESERSIGKRWLRAQTVCIELCQHIIGSLGNMAFKENLECTATHRSKPQPCITAIGLGLHQGTPPAAAVVVPAQADDS